MKKLLSYKITVVYMLLSIFLNAAILINKYEKSEKSDIDFLIVAVCIIFLVLLSGRHKMGADNTFVSLYSLFLLYISLARFIYALFPYNILGFTLAVTAIILVIVSFYNLYKIYKPNSKNDKENYNNKQK